MAINEGVRSQRLRKERGYPKVEGFKTNVNRQFCERIRSNNLSEEYE
jgi:hypothetical protein